MDFSEFLIFGQRKNAKRKFNRKLKSKPFVGSSRDYYTSSSSDSQNYLPKK